MSWTNKHIARTNSSSSNNAYMDIGQSVLIKRPQRINNNDKGHRINLWQKKENNHSKRKSTSDNL